MKRRDALRLAGLGALAGRESSSMKTLILAALAACSLSAAAQSPPLHQYPDADLALGTQLLAEHACAACHVRKVGGDGSAIYRPAGRVNTPSALLSMVQRCSTELNLSLFPEDVAAVAAVLQRDHYRFAAPRPAR